MFQRQEKDTAVKRLRSRISPVLFMTLEGEPMRFFLRPGPTKQRLHPQITAGGGLVTRAQDQAGAILLADPEEFESLHKNVSHRYVSTKYIQDCVEKNEQLEVEDYRFSPEIKGPSTTKTVGQRSSGTSLGGRIPYTPEEDAAILSYIAKHKDRSTGGNRLWQEMGKDNVTGHTWQSMKAHYKCLARQQMTPEQKRTNESDTKADHHTPSENSQSDSEEMDVTNAPQQELVILDDSSTAESAPGTPTPPRLEKQQTASPAPAQPPPPSPRKQLTLDGLPVPQVVLTRLALSSLPISSLERARVSVSPPPSKKPKSTDTLPPPKDTSTPQKRKDTSTEQDAVQNGTSPPRGDSGAMVSDNGQASVSAEKQAGGKRKRKLGILEMASKEFESSDDDQTPDLGPGPTTPQEKGQPPEEGAACPSRAVPLPSGPPEEGAACPSAAVPLPTGPPTSTKPTLSKAHLFIFDSESQDARSQAVVNNNAGTASSCPPPPQQRKEDAVVSLTQTQLGDDIQQIKALMKQTNKDLQSVTKAVLWASGDFALARSLLLTPSSLPGPVWTRSDDNLLRSGDFVVRERLQDKYGAEAVAKRLLFLEELKSLTKALVQASEDLAVAWSLLLAPSSVLGPFWSRWTCFDDNFLRSRDLVVRERLQDKFGEEAVAKRMLFLEVE